MSRFEVVFTTEAVFTVEAEDFEQAEQDAYDLLANYLASQLDWRCEEIIDLDEEQEWLEALENGVLDYAESENYRMDED